MNKKIFFGNLLGVLSLSFFIVGCVTLFDNPFIGTILNTIGLVSLFIAIYIHELITKQIEKEENESKPTTSATVDEISEEKRQKELIKKKKEYEIYLDAKTALMVDAFAILTDKRTNKQTRARKLRKIIRSNPFNIDKFEE